MKRLFGIAIVATTIGAPTFALFAQAQNPSAADLRANAQIVVKMISGDKAKTQTYCEIAKLGGEMDEADRNRDTKKGDVLSQKLDELGKQLGPEYVALMDGLQDSDPDSEEEIGSMLQTLDKLCAR
jgi:hypothetical protein